MFFEKFFLKNSFGEKCEKQMKNLKCFILKNKTKKVHTLKNNFLKKKIF